jgi:type IV pilus assembly protein PilB
VLILGMAQRLVKTLCPGGGKKVHVDNSTAVMLTEEFKDLPEEYRKDLPPLSEVYMPESTPECPTGTKGRIAVTEMFAMNQELERAILARVPEEEMFATVRKQGMLTMKEDAIIKAVQGVVPFTEVNALGGTFDIQDEDAQPAKDAAAATPPETPAPAPVPNSNQQQIEI